MAIEHRDLPESGLHEPKGVSLAPSNRVYVSNGTGSGVWAPVDADVLKGTLNNNIPAGRRVETDGSGGFTAQVAPANAFGTLNLTDNTTPQAVVAAADPSLQTDSDYQTLTTAVTYEAVRNVSTGANSLIVQIEGLYLIDFWCNIKSSTNGSLVGIKFVKNGTTFVNRGIKHKLETAGNLKNMSGNGIHTFAQGDVIELSVASSTSSDITIESMTFQMVYLGTF